MMLSTERADLYAVVADALGCSPDSLTAESAMYRDHGWDSFGHVSVMTAIGEKYGVTIDDDLMTSLTTMKAIVEFLSARENVKHARIARSSRR